MAPQVLFIYNEHLATEGLLGEAFTECGFDVATFEVVPAERVDEPAGEVTFPDPTDYDVIVPLGARWPVYDEALRRHLGRRGDADDARCRGRGRADTGRVLRRSAAGSGVRRVGCPVGDPRDRLVRRDKRRRDPGARRTVVPMAFRRAGRCRPAPRRSPGPRTRHRRSCSAGRWRCSSTRSSTTTCWSAGLATTATARSQASACSHDELRSAQRNSTDSAARRIRGLVRGFLSRVARQPCPS